MGESVYVDLFFLINFSMDFLCFFLTARLLHRRLSMLRMLAAAALGGVYAVLALFFVTGRLLSLVLDVGVCALMCLVALGEVKKLRRLPLYVLVYTAISMALGGIMTALFSLFNRSSVLEGVEPTEGDGISVWTFFLLALISGILTLLGGRFFRKKTAQTRASISVSYEGKTVRLSALTDSGNLLREPLSGKPCIVADVDAMESILPREVFFAAKNDPTSMEKIAPRYARSLRIIPTNTAAGRGILLGLRAEKITVDCGNGEQTVDATIALSDLGASADGNDALLPSELLI